VRDDPEVHHAERDDYNRGMPRSVLVEAASLLAAHYGPHAPPGPVGAWTTLVRVVLEQGRSQKSDRDWSWLDDSPLSSAQEAATCDARGLAERLDTAGQPANKAAVLRGLAAWWEGHAADNGAPDFQGRPLEAWQAELRAIRGVSWELADRILLFFGALNVYPLDRGSMRIAARHGWMDMTAEYDDWQAFFAGASRDAPFDLVQLSRWNARVAREFCGRLAACDECPLRSLLPPRGPIALEEQV
jgi:endonuclease-3 related protein